MNKLEKSQVRLEGELAKTKREVTTLQDLFKEIEASVERESSRAEAAEAVVALLQADEQTARLADFHAALQVVLGGEERGACPGETENGESPPMATEADSISVPGALEEGQEAVLRRVLTPAQLQKHAELLSGEEALLQVSRPTTPPVGHLTLATLERATNCGRGSSKLELLRSRSWFAPTQKISLNSRPLTRAYAAPWDRSVWLASLVASEP